MALTQIQTSGIANNAVTDAKVADAITVTGAQTGITQVGTLTAGTWNGTAIASAYLDADTAHLSGTQTFTGDKTFSDNVIITTADNDTTTALKVLALDDGGYDGTVLEVYGTRGPTTGYNIAKFGTNASTPKIVFDGEGKVGIGTTSPDEMLHLKSSTSAKPVLKIENTNDDATAPTLEFCKNPATDDTDNDVVGQIDFIRQNDEGNERTWGQIRTYNTDAGAEYGQVRIGAKKGAGSPTDILYIGGTSGGNVGIGTDSPQRVLDVKGTSDQPVDGIFRVLGTSEYAIEMGVHDASPWGTWIQSGYYVNGAGTFTSAGHLNLNPSGGRVGIGTDSPSDDGISIAYPGSAPQLQLKMASSGHVHISNNTADKDMNFATAGTGDMYFAPGGTNYVAFLDSGKVGIGGVLDPDNALEVKGGNDDGIKLTDASGNVRALIRPDGGGDGQLLLYDASGNNKVSINTDGGTTFEGGGVTVGGDITGPTSFNLISSDTVKLTSTQNSTKAVCFDGYNFRPDAGAGDNVHDCGTSNRRWNDIYATNSSIQTSDKNQKKEIKNSSLGLGFLNLLTAREYKWKNGERKHYGLVAQEVEKVLTDNNIDSKDFAPFIKFVNEDTGEDGYGFRYGEMVGILIKAVQELSDKVTELENA